ncbi:hypothetical protein P3B99_007315 [Opitutia bacterium KCR 482]|nr:hypothetical protein [Opitutae bacterium KCR 482]MDF3287062.1 hypothetical protein [Opitutae bacterium KCR 482]
MTATFAKPTQRARKGSASRRRGGKMTPEESYYWGLWAEIKRKFGLTSDDTESLRKDITEQIFGGESKSHKSFKHGDYDVVLGAMRELLKQSSLVVYPEKVVAMYMEGETRRIAHLIDELEMPPAYIAAISFGKFHTRDWRNGLLAFEMMQLFYTCKARLYAYKKAGKTFTSTPAAAIDDDNCPF